ncbi:isochorismatase family protein [Acidipila sp. EB88]|uniref:isochorismatase family protein n=1 Tax=Acidipila sp. EB88 TaxID=2305226 RepID=UPI0013150B14|nr:isochorismatase family protein [Acidipila sp. EB88]
MLNRQSAWAQLSAGMAQVLFCDLQKAIVKHGQTNIPKALASAAGALLQLTKIFDLPAVVSVVPHGSDSQVITELEGAESVGPKLLRTTNRLVADPPTLQAIKRSDRKVLIVAGFMMEAVVLDTVLDARAAGYEVLVAVDACGSPSLRTEQSVLRQMESAGAVPTSVISIRTKLSPGFSTDEGKQMFAAVQAIKYA